MEELVSRLFALRDASHLSHWSASSLSEHEALGEFYGALIDKIDSIIEAYQGAYGKIKGVKPRDYTQGDILGRIIEEANWIADNREEISRNNSVIENQLDDLGAFYLKTTYKLRFLR